MDVNGFVCASLYVCMYIYIYICVFVYMCVCMYVCVCMCIYVIPEAAMTLRGRDAVTSGSMRARDGIKAYNHTRTVKHGE